MRTVSRAGLLNKKLKKGYTTGTCAAAASTAAVSMLFTGEIIQQVEVTLPGGRTVTLKLVGQDIARDKDETTNKESAKESDKKINVVSAASCGVVKDAGDDPDVTHGMVIYARAERRGSGITISAGEGIGTVTKPGLSVQVGEPAINPVPRKMIMENVSGVLPEGEGVEVTICAPEGVERAKKTMNAKLGVIGGISILGTTGIVRPMSLSSLIASLLPQVDIASALGYKTVALVPGNMGEKVAKNKLKFPEDAVIQMSNFVGDMLEYCAKKGIERVLLLGHIGKMAKVAGGFFDTHSGKTDDPVEIMKRLIRGYTKDTAPMMFLLRVNTAEEAAVGLSEMGQSRLLDKIAEEVTARAVERIGGRIEIGTAITVLSGDIVATDASAKHIIRDSKW